MAAILASQETTMVEAATVGAAELIGSQLARLRPEAESGLKEVPSFAEESGTKPRNLAHP
jgi:hypothetical protein